MHSSLLRRSFALSALSGLFLSTTVIAATGDTISSSSMSSESSSSVLASSSSSSDDNLTLVNGSGANLAEGRGTIVIEQRNGSGTDIIGQWTLITPMNTQRAGQTATVTMPDYQAGNYTLLIEPPDGTSAGVRVYRNGTLEKLVERPQVNFRVENRDLVKVVIHYVFTRVGQVTIDSDPPGVGYTMTGPNNTKFTGVTPMSYAGLAVGQYQVKYDGLTGCAVPAPKSLLLQEAGRISFSIKLACEAADKIRERLVQEQQNNTEYISITIAGKTTKIHDVPQSAWFATYVTNVAKYGILSGYQDAAGNLTGEYGPGNNVTIAELAKIAHKMAGISTDALTSATPDNTLARGQWFAPFVASAEQRGWLLYGDARVDPTRPATRAEVLVTLYQALDLPISWPKGTVFTDVSARVSHAGAIETAAAKKIVEGQKDDKGNDLHLFNPTQPINRAELAKMLSKMIEVYRTTSSSSVR